MTEIDLSRPQKSPERGLQAGLARVAAILAFIALWEVAAVYVADPIWIGRPSAVMVRLWALLQSGELARDASFTIYHALAGLALSFVVGVPVGLLFGSYTAIASTFDTLLLGFYSLPRVALAPLFILWFGIGEFSKIMMTFSMVVFVVILNTYEGLRGIDPDLVDMMRAMRARPSYILRKVRLPTIVPWLTASARVGIGLALVGSVIGELLGANRGLGWYIEYSAARLDITGVFAGLMVLMIVGMALNEAVRLIDNTVWRKRTGTTTAGARS